MQVIFEGGGNAKISAAAAQGPEQIRVVLLTGMSKLAVRTDDVDADQVVDAEPETAHQQPDSPAERETRDTGVADGAERRGETEGLRRAIQFPEQHAALCVRSALLRIDADFLHRAHVDHQAALRHGVARHTVTAGVHAGEQLVRAGEVHRVDDVLRIGAAHDERRVSVEGRIPDATRGVIAFIGRQQQRPM